MIGSLSSLRAAMRVRTPTRDRFTWPAKGGPIAHDGTEVSATALTRSRVREHVALVAVLPQEATERAPDLGEEVVAEIEGLGDVGASVVRGPELVPPGIHRSVAHHDRELEDLTGHALGDLACGPVETGQFSLRLRGPGTAHRPRAGGAVDPLGLDHLGAVLTHLRDVADGARPCPAGHRCGG